MNGSFNVLLLNSVTSTHILTTNSVVKDIEEWKMAINQTYIYILTVPFDIFLMKSYYGLTQAE